MKNFLTILFCATLTASYGQKHQLTKIWETDSLAVPESVLINDKKDFLFTSLIDGGGNVADGRGGIAKISLDGKILDANWVSGLNAPKGIGKSGKKLYVADLTEVAVVNIASRKVELKIPIIGSVFLNDVTVDSKGNAFVSDTRIGKIYKIKGNKAELWIENIADANGLKAINDDLYVLSGKKLLKISPDKTITTVAEGFAKNGDGVEPLQNGDFIVTCWNGLVYYVSKDGSIELLLDTQSQKINTADLAVNQAENILYIPTFNHKSIIAYKLSEK